MMTPEEKISILEIEEIASSEVLEYLAEVDTAKRSVNVAIAIFLAHLKSLMLSTDEWLMLNLSEIFIDVENQENSHLVCVFRYLTDTDKASLTVVIDFYGKNPELTFFYESPHDDEEYCYDSVLDFLKDLKEGPKGN